MTMIEIDHFLEIYLKIKYDVYWSVKETKISFTAALSIRSL